jgi:hypothetical protein
VICFKTARRDHSSSIIQLKICQDRLRTGQLQDLPRQAAARFCFERVCLCLEWSVSQDAQSTWELFQNLSDRLRGMPLCGLIRSSSSLFPLPRVFPSVFRKPGSVYQDRLGTRSSLARERQLCNKQGAMFSVGTAAASARLPRRSGSTRTILQVTCIDFVVSTRFQTFLFIRVPSILSWLMIV